MGEKPTEANAVGCGCIALLAIAVVIGVVSSLLGGDSDEDPRPDGPTYDGAISVCHQAVEEQLKAPSTAEFGGDSADGGTDGQYSVVGYVDAENSFGASIRTTWTCDAKWVGGGRWSVAATLIEG